MGLHTHSITVKAAIIDLAQSSVDAELQQFIDDGQEGSNCTTDRGWIFTGWAVNVTDGHDTLYCEEITYLGDESLCAEYRRLDDIYQDNVEGSADALKSMEKMTAGKPVVFLLNKEFGSMNYWTILSRQDDTALLQFANDWKINAKIVKNLAITQTI
jgi:hypothetical protein